MRTFSGQSDEPSSRFAFNFYRIFSVDENHMQIFPFELIRNSKWNGKLTKKNWFGLNELFTKKLEFFVFHFKNFHIYLYFHRVLFVHLKLVALQMKSIWIKYRALRNSIKRRDCHIQTAIESSSDFDKEKKHQNHPIFYFVWQKKNKSASRCFTPSAHIKSAARKMTEMQN